MLSHAILCLIVLASAFGDFSEEEKTKLIHDFEPKVMECLEEFNIEKKEFDEKKESEDMTGLDNCFFACVFKGTDMINEKGLFDDEATYKHISLFVESEDKRATMKKIAEDCASVNNVEVKDGIKGCERSALLAQCLRSHMEEIGKI